MAGRTRRGQRPCPSGVMIYCCKPVPHAALISEFVPTTEAAATLTPRGRALPSLVLSQVDGAETPVFHITRDTCDAT